MNVDGKQIDNLDTFSTLNNVNIVIMLMEKNSIIKIKNGTIKPYDIYSLV